MREKGRERRREKLRCESIALNWQPFGALDVANQLRHIPRAKLKIKSFKFHF